MRKVLYLFILTPLILISACGGIFPKKIGRRVYDAGQLPKERETYFVVSVKGANLRSGPGTGFNTVGHAGEGDKYTVLELNQPSGEDYYWFRVETDRGGEVWISGSVGHIEGELDEAENVFDALPDEIWSSTLAGLQWMKWEPVFIDKEKRSIRLKEAYVYSRFGKIFRIYRWPPIGKADGTDIDEYLEKIARYDTGSSDFEKAVFSQESMQVRLSRLSQSQTKIDIDYKIKPYLESGKFGEQIRSNGYMESLLLEKIRANFGRVSLY